MGNGLGSRSRRKSEAAMIEPIVTDLSSIRDMMAKSKNSLPEGYNYSSIYDYVLDRGKLCLSEELTAEENRFLKSCLRYHRPKFKGCFSNAQKLVLKDTTERLVYVEGYAYGPAQSFPMHHGWVTLNNKVIDTTWGPVYGKLPETWRYFGVSFSREDIYKTCLARKGELWSIIDDWKNGWPVLQQPRLHESQHV